MSRKPFKPIQCWAVYRNGKPRLSSIREDPGDSVRVFCKQMGDHHEFAWFEARGYSVGKIVVSPFEGK